MATKVRIARTAQELDDVFRVRHQVYVLEENKFSGADHHRQRLADYFDAMPGTVNIIAYNNDEPVGTLRINQDLGAGLPATEHYDFQDYWEALQAEHPTLKRQSALASGGMLAIRREWRRRRDVILAMFKLATGILRNWGTYSMIATVNYETVSIYERAGFVSLNEPLWIESIGNFIVPLAAPCNLLYRYTFGELQETWTDLFWLETFADKFERLLLQPGEIVFREGDLPCSAFIVDSGLLTISRQSSQEKELTLATLSRGDLFGELALIDDEPRSASVMAQTNVELISLDRSIFLEALKACPHRTQHLLKTITHRMRRTDHLALMMAYAPHRERIRYVLNDIRKAAVRDRKRPDTAVVKLGVSEVAKLAGIPELEVRSILNLEQEEGNLEYNDHIIRFLAWQELATVLAS